MLSGRGNCHNLLHSPFLRQHHRPWKKRKRWEGSSKNKKKRRKLRLEGSLGIGSCQQPSGQEIKCYIRVATAWNAVDRLTRMGNHFINVFMRINRCDWGQLYSVTKHLKGQNLWQSIFVTKKKSTMKRYKTKPKVVSDRGEGSVHM